VPNSDHGERAFPVSLPSSEQPWHGSTGGQPENHKVHRVGVHVFDRIRIVL